MLHFAGMRYSGGLASPPVDGRAIPFFWKEPDEPVRTPPGSGGPPAVIQVFTLVHEVALIFRSGGDSRDRKDRESPLALLSLQCRRGCAVKETKREKVRLKRVPTLSTDIRRTKNSSDQPTMSRR